MAEPLVPQVDIRFDFLSFRKHSGSHIVRFEDEHPQFSTPLRDYLAFFFFDEAPEMSKSNLHALVDNFSDRHQVLGDCQYMQDISHYSFLVLVPLV